MTTVSLPDTVLPAVSGKKLFVSLSGGCDSMVLLTLFFELQQAQPGLFRLYAVHFEHGIRGEESRSDAAFCEEFCRIHSIPFQMISLAVPENRQEGEGVEEAARRLRQQAWIRVIGDSSDSVIALGHHADDRRENLLLRLFRGSNSSGLASMREVQTINGLTFLRPLLAFSRSELESYAAAHGIRYRVDSTNADPAYKRNYLRRELLPSLYEAIPYSRGGMTRAIRALEQDADALEQIASAAYEKIRITDHTQLPALSGTLFYQELPAVRVRILRLFFRDATGRDLVPDAALCERLEKPSVGKIPLAGLADTFLKCDHDRITIVKMGSESGSPYQYDWNCRTQPDLTGNVWHLHAEWLTAPFPGSGDAILFDAALIRLPLTVRSRMDGDRMIPFGSASPEPVRLKKLFSSAEIPPEQRDRYPVVTDADGRIIWLAGIRRSNAAPVTQDTKEVLQLTVSWLSSGKIG